MVKIIRSSMSYIGAISSPIFFSIFLMYLESRSAKNMQRSNGRMMMNYLGGGARAVLDFQLSMQE
jgi:hypothetical protein